VFNNRFGGPADRMSTDPSLARVGLGQGLKHPDSFSSLLNQHRLLGLAPCRRVAITKAELAHHFTGFNSGPTICPWVAGSSCVRSCVKCVAYQMTMLWPAIDSPLTHRSMSAS
jgi:hypothetical protein